MGFNADFMLNNAVMGEGLLNDLQKTIDDTLVVDMRGWKLNSHV